MKNAKNAFIRGALEGAFKGGAYNIADVLDNKLRNAYGSKKPAVRSPRNPRGVQPARSRCPQKECVKSRPLAGMNYPGKGGSGGSFAPQNDRFSLGRFARDIAIGAVMGGLASVAFYKTGKGVEALEWSIEGRKTSGRHSNIYYHVTTEERAQNIMKQKKLGNGRWENHVFAWKQQPTEKQASIAGIGRECQTVLKFETNASFTKDRGNKEKRLIKDIAVESVEGQRIPINIWNIEIVGFRKEWWKRWRK